MENNKIQILLDKYFEEQTSLKEELVLKEYFNGDTVTDALLPYQALFEYVAEEQMLTLGSSFDEKILHIIQQQEDIPSLLDKYFEEKTSPEEESTLRDYFNKEDVAEELLLYKPLFEFVQEEQNISLNSDFDAKLLQQIAQKEIQIVVNKYFEGETTLEEEASLQEYFNSGNVAPELQKYQALFAFIKEEKETRTSQGFESQVLAKIKGNSAGLRVVSRRYQFLRVAAGVALLVGMFFFIQNNLNNKTNITTAETVTIDWSKYEVKTEAEAIAETEEAMRILAKAFNRGTKKASKDLKKVGEATKVLN